MKKALFLLFMVLFSTILSAQNIVVESFVHLEADLTANLEGTTVYDQNGEKCALIKVRPIPFDDGFTFDVGQLGVMRTETKETEIWVYVPYGVRKISIHHKQLGHIDDYDLGMSVKKASTYLLTLRVGRVQTIVEEQLLKQFLMFRLEPKDAVVEVGGEPWIPDANGVCRKLLSFGSYDYYVRAKDYHTEAGKVTLDNTEETKILQVNLRPAYGWIEVGGAGELSGAVVYVDDKMIGRAPVKTDRLASGSHSVRIVKELFRAYVEEVVVEDNKTKTLSPTLIADFSTVTVTTKQGAEIWVDGESRGTTSWTGRLSFGEHLMETKLASHRNQSRVIDILPTEATKMVQLPEPQPIYGSLSVEVLPNFADVYIDGVKVGPTPKFISQILVGEHKVEVRAEGKELLEKKVVIKEGEMSSVTGELKDAPKDLVFNVKGVQFKMKYVEGGTFMMGDDNQRIDLELKEALYQEVYNHFSQDCEVSHILIKIEGGDTLQAYNYARKIIARLKAGEDFAKVADEVSADQSVVRNHGYLGWFTALQLVWPFEKAMYELPLNTISSPIKSDHGYHIIKVHNRRPAWGQVNASHIMKVTSESMSPEGRAKKYNEMVEIKKRLDAGESFEALAKEFSDDKGSAQKGGELGWFGIGRMVREFEKVAFELEPNQTSDIIKTQFGYHIIYVKEKKGIEPFEKKKADIQRMMQYNSNSVSEQGSGDNADEKPAHKVTLDDYYIGETEVTQALWYAVMGKNTSYYTGNSNLPVEQISWDDCQEFIKKLNQLTGQTFSLPTEAQWEFAARGGNQSRGYKYSGSNDLNSVAWYDNNSDSKTHPIAQKQPNELGLYDMSGNVWEWCSDWYSSTYYSSSPQQNPQGPSSGSLRVNRGGSWGHDALLCRVANRDGNYSSVRRNNYGLGLRLALVPSH